MIADLAASLQSYFGFPGFRPGQVEAIQSLLNGQHTLVVMPTGSGKSLVFQLAALHRPGLSLVVSPLIALMKDQVDNLERRGIPVTFINSTLSGIEQNRRLKALAEGNYRLVYVAPERLRNLPFLTAVQRQKVSLLAVDEAHCISEWGHDFRPDYLHIAKFRADLGDPLTVALTATATPKVQDDIARLLGLQQVRRVVTGFNRPNLTLEVRSVASLPARLKALQELLAPHCSEATIIYTGTRRDAEEVAEFVRAVLKIDAQHYHAGLSTEERTHIQDSFMIGSLSVIVATNAFGMGIDRPDVRQVVHYSLPGSLEAYYQEAGRAGRDGLPARAILLYSPEDRVLQEWFIENSAISVPDLQLLFDALRPASEKQDGITISHLSCQTGLQEVKVRVGLAELERSGAVENLGEDGSHILVNIKSWNASHIQAVTGQLKQHQLHRKALLQDMIEYAESNACRRRIILKYFGDPDPAKAAMCCDNCLVQPNTQAFPKVPGQLSQSERVPLVLLDTVRRLQPAVGREKVAQILKGSKAKDILRFGYDKSPYYGRLTAFSQDKIKDLLDQLIECSYLKLVGGQYPVLRITPKGEAAVREKAIIPIRLPRPRAHGTIEWKEQERQADGTLDYTNMNQLPGSKISSSVEIGHIVALGESGSKLAVPELIAYLSNRDGNVRRLAASALGKIGDKRASNPLIELLEGEAKPQVRQYAVKALGQTGDLNAIKILKAISQDAHEKDYTRKAAENALKKLKNTSTIRIIPTEPSSQESTHQQDDPITNFLQRPHPRQLSGPWRSGWALGFHSRFTGANWSRSEAGDLAYRLKYQVIYRRCPRWWSRPLHSFTAIRN